MIVMKERARPIGSKPSLCPMATDGPSKHLFTKHLLPPLHVIVFLPWKFKQLQHLPSRWLKMAYNPQLPSLSLGPVFLWNPLYVHIKLSLVIFSC